MTSDSMPSGADYVADVLIKACTRLAVAMKRNHIADELALQELLSIAGQESYWRARHQWHGTAHGLWQFEHGDMARGGGVCGVWRHTSTKDYLDMVCSWYEIKFNPTVIWEALQSNDELAACVARLLLWTDAHPLPENEREGWVTYSALWRPGKPHPESWRSRWRTSARVLTVKLAPQEESTVPMA